MYNVVILCLTVIMFYIFFLIFYVMLFLCEQISYTVVQHAGTILCAPGAANYRENEPDTVIHVRQFEIVCANDQAGRATRAYPVVRYNANLES